MKMIHSSRSPGQDIATRLLPATQEATMFMRSEPSIRTANESSTRKQEGPGFDLRMAALALVLIFLAAVSAVFAPAPSDSVAIEAQSLIGP
jgi:hypothetical protein